MRKRRQNQKDRLRVQLEKMDGDGIQLLINQLQKRSGQNRTIKLCEEVLIARAVRNLVKSTVALPFKVALGAVALGGKLAFKGIRKLV